MLTSWLSLTFFVTFLENKQELFIIQSEVHSEVRNDFLETVISLPIEHLVLKLPFPLSKLRNDIENGERPKFDRRIYITLPKEKDHKEHVIGEICYLSKSLILLFVSLF